MYKFFNAYKNTIDKDLLKKALQNTARKRNSLADVNDALDIISEIRNEKYLKDLWDNYTSSNAYSAQISFTDVVDNLLDVAAFLS